MSRGATPSAVYIDGVEVGRTAAALTFVADDNVPPDTVVAINTNALAATFELAGDRAVRFAEVLAAWLDTVAFVDHPNPDEGAGVTIDQLIDNIDDVLEAHRRQP